MGEVFPRTSREQLEGKEEVVPFVPSSCSQMSWNPPFSSGILGKVDQKYDDFGVEEFRGA
jgi:hypothetical protein